MANIFNSVKGLHPKRNKFTADTYRNDFTAPLGVDIPCFWAEVPPATRFKVSTSALVRLQALIAPVMDNIDYYVHFWKVPYRLIENDRFTKFISGEIEGDEYDALFATPYELATATFDLIDGDTFDEFSSNYEKVFGNGSLLDFLGYDRGLFPDLEERDESWDFVPGTGNNSTIINWRGLIVYFMLHSNWYMNENVEYFDQFLDLVDSLVKDQSVRSLATLLARTTSMNDNYVCLLPHAWDKDYFTSALPNVQFGEPVTLPIAGTAPVTIPASTADNLQAILLKTASEAAGIPILFNNEIAPGASVPLEAENLSNEPSKGAVLGNEAGDYITRLSGFLGNSLNGSADLSEASAITINELRFANALQVFKERQMRFGRRRLEYYKGFFDVEPEDLRLQVPKYLGGGRIPINIADIEQTSQTTEGDNALGRLAGKGTAVAGGFAGFSTFCSEETYIIGIAFAIPHITYAQQLSRFKMKTNDIYDYFNPSFEHLGEQPIYNIELFAGTDNPSGEFGYTPRYTEYRFHNNEMHGAFKDTLSFWTLGRIFEETPALNAQFVYMQPKVFDRIFAVENQPNMLVSMLFHTRAIKPVSKYGTPMLLA